MINHNQIDERNLTLHRLIVEKLRTEPALIEYAIANAERWLADCAPGTRPALEECSLGTSGFPV